MACPLDQTLMMKSATELLQTPVGKRQDVARRDRVYAEYATKDGGRGGER